MERAAESLSLRGRVFIPKESSPLLDAIIHCARNAFDAETNPDGWINAGTAENNLSVRELCDGFQRAMASLTPATLKYDAFEGEPVFLSAVARFMETWLRVPVNAQSELIATCGAGTALSNLSLVIADAGDAIIIPTPCYGALPMDIGVLAGLHMVNAPLAASDYFCLNVSVMEEAWKEATGRGLHVRAILLTNPDNPTGRVHAQQSLLEIYHWAKAHSLHIICDEIYADSVFSGEFASIAHVLHHAGVWMEPFAQTHLHIVYGFAKDFSASGLRTGVIFTRNQSCHKALASISPFSSISRPTQLAMSSLLSNHEWLERYRADNKSKLLRAYKHVTSSLETLQIPYIPASAGLFFSLDLRSFLNEPTVAAEMDLFRHIFSFKVYITPGTAFFFKEPGYFRLIFAHPDAALDTLVARLKDALSVYKQK